MDAVVSAIGLAAILLMLGWLKLDVNRLSDRVEVLAERIIRIETRLDERKAPQ